MPRKEKDALGVRLGEIVLTYKVFFVLLLLILVVSVLTDKFFTNDNIFNVLRQITSNTLVACGFTYIIASGYFDLSVGANLALTGIVMAKAMVGGAPAAAAIVLGLVCAMCFAMVNALTITLFNLPPFIATLATQSVYRGTCYLITGMKPVSGLPADFVTIGQGYIGPVPIPVIIMVIVILITHITLIRSSFGRHVLAVGGNPEAARVCGISVTRVRFGVYALCGFCVGLASIVTTGRASSGQVAAGNNMEMDVIAACVIGGTSMAGGTGNILGTFIGCFIVGIVSNSLNLLKIDSNWQIIAKGLMIMFSLVLDSESTKIMARMRKKKEMANIS